MKARIIDETSGEPASTGIVVEVIPWDPEGRYPPDWVWVDCPPDTAQGATFDGTTFVNPVVEVPEPVPAPLPMLTAMQFYLAFTPTERIAIKQSTDPVVMEFWATYQLAAQLNSAIDPTLTSIVSGLAYLARPTDATPPGPGILASTDRIAEIQAGVAQ